MDRVATIGFFDGVHRGHQFLIDRVKEMACERGMESLVVTFRTLPKSGSQPSLTTYERKAWLLSLQHVDKIETLEFTPELKSMTARAFMEDVLKKQFGVRVLVIGYDHRFGHNREEGFEDYVRYGEELGIEVVRAPELTDGDGISSSMIRRLLGDGDVTTASRLLGTNYVIEGRVVDGYKVGRTIGFPTANIAPESIETLLPLNGVYDVLVRIDGEPIAHHGMLNIGLRPTFDGKKTTIEVHLLRYEGNLYGTTLQVAFVERIRGEREFESVEALRQQLNADREYVAAKITG